MTILDSFQVTLTGRWKEPAGAFSFKLATHEGEIGIDAYRDTDGLVRVFEKPGSTFTDIHAQNAAVDAFRLDGNFYLRQAADSWKR